jgi:hypothetical protein
VELWEWLLAHPDGHRQSASQVPPPARRPAEVGA